jgi:ribosomal protein L7/L12
MDDLEISRHITSLQARMNRMETLMQQLLTLMTTSRAEVDKLTQINTMLQDLRLSPGINTGATASINSVAATPQERPEIRAIRDALRSGDKMKAIKLYRSLYGVSLKEAQDALNAM